ncbi:MAG TPA: LPS export ABC transporter periplasmic protein LptC [Chthoniobacteraceae bacterium]|nr:LPS export ABC transporter periplasmic protein LptC [Chthoniobacteraceae bacterium]
MLLALGSQSWAGKKDTPTATPAPSGSPKPKFDVPIPPDHGADFVKLPYFDERGRLQMYFTIEHAFRVDEGHLRLTGAYMQTYDEHQSPDANVTITQGILDLNTRIITSDVPVTVRRSDFQIVGQKMVFNTQTKVGHFSGHVRMIIFNRSEMAKASPTPGASAHPAESPAKKDAATPSGPTIIDSNDMDYDGKKHVSVFTGDYYGVFVNDPSFTVNCDKLTTYMRRSGAAGPKGKGSPARSPAASPDGKANAAANRGSGLQRAVAEGPAARPVVIVQDKPAAAGQEAQHDVGIAQKADYNADTGDIILTGWPRVSQGLDTQTATSGTTFMIMNKDGRTLKTRGSTRTVIQAQEGPEKAGDSSPAQTPGSSPQ